MGKSAQLGRRLLVWSTFPVSLVNDLCSIRAAGKPREEKKKHSQSCACCCCCCTRKACTSIYTHAHPLKHLTTIRIYVYTHTRARTLPHTLTHIYGYFTDTFSDCNSFSYLLRLVYSTVYTMSMYVCVSSCCCFFFSSRISAGMCVTFHFRSLGCARLLQFNKFHLIGLPRRLRLQHISIYEMSLQRPRFAPTAHTDDTDETLTDDSDDSARPGARLVTLTLRLRL